MPRISIPIEQFIAAPYALWEEQWLLLTSGDFPSGKFNEMTVSWGALGSIWGRPFAQVVVRPQRYTFEFMENYPTFTLCGFPADFRPDLQLLGSLSGRDSDKSIQAHLTPIAAQKVAAPIFAEAILAIECKKMYWQDMEPSHFIDPGLNKNYPSQDYHRIYYGEIVAIFGEPAYLRPNP